MTIKIVNLDYLEALTEDREVVGGRRGGGRRGTLNTAGAEAFATGLGRYTDSFTSINADAVSGFGSSSRSEGAAIASNRPLPWF